MGTAQTSNVTVRFSYTVLHCDKIVVRRMTLAPLVHRITHEIQPVYFERIHTLSRDFFKKSKWEFNWHQIIHFSDQEAYSLRLSSDNSIQGFISLINRQSDQFIDVRLVESAPWNRGRQTKEWIAVGQMLFAIACKLSFESGYDGYVSFFSKTKLITHYENTLKAKRFRNNSIRMFIESHQARELVRKFDHLTKEEVLEWIKNQSIY